MRLIAALAIAGGILVLIWTALMVYALLYKPRRRRNAAQTRDREKQKQHRALVLPTSLLRNVSCLVTLWRQGARCEYGHSGTTIVSRALAGGVGRVLRILARRRTILPK
jgi:uncharacterized SAM-binding protein YcdF (DUF218 family)